MKSNKTLLDQSPSDVIGIGIGFVATVMVVLNIAGLLEYSVADRLHAWSIASFASLIVLIITLPVAFLTEIAFEENKIRNKFTQGFSAIYWLVAVVLTSITVLITLWCIHWLLGLVITISVLAAVVGTIIIEYKSKKEE